MWTHGRLLGALAKTAEGLQYCTCSPVCVPDRGVNPGVCAVGWWLWFQVALQALYKQVGTLLPNVRALHTLRLRAVRTATAVASEEGPKRLAVWTRPREGLALRCMVFPSPAFGRSLGTRLWEMGAR
jgi:hypothetical protein